MVDWPAAARNILRFQTNFCHGDWLGLRLYLVVGGIDKGWKCLTLASNALPSHDKTNTVLWAVSSLLDFTILRIDTGVRIPFSQQKTWRKIVASGSCSSQSQETKSGCSYKGCQVTKAALSKRWLAEFASLFGARFSVLAERGARESVLWAQDGRYTLDSWVTRSLNLSRS